MWKALSAIMIVCLSAAMAAAQSDADEAERIRRFQEAIEARARATGRQPPDRETFERMLRARTQGRPASLPPSGMRGSGTQSSGARASGAPSSVTGAVRSSKSRGSMKRLVVSVDQARFLQTERVVYRVRHLPARDLANTVSKLLMSEAAIAAAQDRTVSPLTVIPESVTNSLIVSGPDDLIDGVLDLIQDLDRQQQMVSIDVLVAEVVIGASDQPDRSISVSHQSIGDLAAKLDQRPGLRILARPRLATMEGQPTSLTLGRREPRVARTSRSAGRSSSGSRDDLGLTLGVSTRVGPDGLVTMEIDLEKSHPGADEEGIVVAAAKQGEPVRTPPVRTFKAQTAVSVADGQTAILAGIAAGGGPHPIELILLVSPRIAK